MKDASLMRLVTGGVPIRLPVLALCIAAVAGFTTDELSLFDLVEEINENFYVALGVEHGASTTEIKKAYRKLSLVWHPDRSADPNADVKFRQIAAMYDVLKSETLRERYDEVLEHGLPDWRQPIFYYRRLRKMPWWETLLFFVAIMTTGHYLVLWAIYAERRLVLESNLDKIRKKQKKLERAGVDVDDAINKELSSIEKPTWKDILPLVISRAILGLPSALLCLYADIKEYRAQQKLAQEQAEAELRELAEVANLPEKPAKRRPVVEAPDAADLAELSAPVIPVLNDISAEENAKNNATRVTGAWSSAEVTELLKLTSKYPIGTVDRWEKIAEFLCRHVNDVTKMVGDLKKLDPSEYQKLVPQESQSAKPDESDWSKSQQKCLEAALVTFPKSHPARWERIAGAVPGKTKEQCVERYKTIVEAVRRRKAASRDRQTKD